MEEEEEARKRKIGRLTVRELRGMGVREMRHRGGGDYHPRPPWLF